MKNIFVLLILLYSLSKTMMVFATEPTSNGDDTGNGGFAYKQSKLLLEMASNELFESIKSTSFPMVSDYENRRNTLLNVLPYEEIDKRENENAYRLGRLLMFDYKKNPMRIVVYKSYFMAFAGTTDAEFDIKKVEVKKRLLHEASHLWGFNEGESSSFSYGFLEHEQQDADIDTPVNLRHDIRIDSNYCACRNGESYLGNHSHCNQFCRTMPEKVPTLFVKAILSSQDQHNSEIGNFYNWCSKELGDGYIAPSCSLEFFDGYTTDYIPIRPTKDGFTADVSRLKYLKDYLIKVVSNTGVKSDAINLKLQRPNIHVTPLLTTNVSRYHCLKFQDSTQKAINLFTYFLPEVGYQTNIYPYHFCHDIWTYGMNDSPLFPRIGEVEDDFKVFDREDIRFLDKDSNGLLDVDELISDLLQRRYGINHSSAFFEPLKDLRSNKILGFYLKPILENGKLVCPTKYSTLAVRPLFATLLDLLPTETEGLYIAKRQNLPEAEPEHLFIRESVLKKIWFHFLNGKFVYPTSESSTRKRVMFFWPPDSDEPHVQKYYQRIYTVIKDYRLDTPDKIRSDKKFGCVPKSYEDIPPFLGHTGASCSSDFECNSLCCNGSKCKQVDLSNGLRCDKSPGDTCFSDRQCKEMSSTTCKKVKTGFNVNGNTTCAVICSSEMSSGYCHYNRCFEPPLVEMPDNPGDCSDAVDP